MDILSAVCAGWLIGLISTVAGAMIALKAGRGTGLFVPTKGDVAMVPDEFASPEADVEDEMAKVFDERASRFIERLRDGKTQEAS